MPERIQVFRDPHTLLADCGAPPPWPTFTYTRRHLPTGRDSEAKVIAPDRAAFHALLAHWSRSAPSTWQYWESAA